MTDSAYRALGAWGNRTTFVLVLAAAAVGLGSLWRFAWLTGTHGGGAFVISYVFCLFLFAVPLLVAELVIGSYGRATPALAIRHLADRSLLSRQWMWLGVLACLTGFLILCCQVVVAGWSLSYFETMQSQALAAASPQVVAEHFQDLLSDTGQQLKWLSLYVLVLVLVLGIGGRRGLAVMAWLIVPIMVTLLAMLLLFALEVGDLAATRDFLFSVKPVDISAQTFLAALGHALLTLGTGVGSGILFGAYAPDRIPLGRSVMAVAVFDTMLALLSGLVIFSLIFANNVEPAAGPGLLFIALPYAFGNILNGELFGSVFFALLLITSLGFSLALLAPLVTSLKQHLKLKRPVAAILAGSLLWLCGWQLIINLAGAGSFSDHNLFASLDTLAASVLLPVVALLTAVLLAWRFNKKLLQEQLSRESKLSFSLWRGLLRYIAPLAVIVLLAAPFYS